MAIVGALLVAAGLYQLIKPLSYSSEQSVVKFGGFEAQVRSEKTVPPWVGGVALGAGCVLVVIGLAKKR
jgi:hypothetical protein